MKCLNKIIILILGLIIPTAHASRMYKAPTDMGKWTPKTKPAPASQPAAPQPSEADRARLEREREAEQLRAEAIERARLRDEEKARKAAKEAQAKAEAAAKTAQAEKERLAEQQQRERAAQEMKAEAIRQAQLEKERLAEEKRRAKEAQAKAEAAAQAAQAEKESLAEEQRRAREAQAKADAAAQAAKAQQSQQAKPITVYAYEILGVDSNADANIKKKAYLKLAQKWHPDKNPDQIDFATAVFKAINNANDSTLLARIEIAPDVATALNISFKAPSFGPKSPARPETPSQPQPRTSSRPTQSETFRTVYVSPAAAEKIFVTPGQAPIADILKTPAYLLDTMSQEERLQLIDFYWKRWVHDSKTTKGTDIDAETKTEIKRILNDIATIILRGTYTPPQPKTSSRPAQPEPSTAKQAAAPEIIRDDTKYSYMKFINPTDINDINFEIIPDDKHEKKMSFPLKPNEKFATTNAIGSYTVNFKIKDNIIASEKITLTTTSAVRFEFSNEGGRLLLKTKPVSFPPLETVENIIQNNSSIPVRVQTGINSRGIKTVILEPGQTIIRFLPIGKYLLNILNTKKEASYTSLIPIELSKRYTKVKFEILDDPEKIIVVDEYYIS